MKLQVQKKMERTILKHYTQLYQLLFGIKSQLRKAIVFVSSVFSVLRNWNFCKGLWTYFLHFHAFLLCNYFFYLMHTDVRLLFPCSYFLFISTVSWYGHFTYISHTHTHTQKRKNLPLPLPFLNNSLPQWGNFLCWVFLCNSPYNECINSKICIAFSFTTMNMPFNF